ncbi:MAG: NAD(P)-dependent oxidoreductase [Holophagaceae bacterium]|uniref:NAD(P)-dependent oxidoreductase n=1 Tax=Candidatus Geothrix skivensis TaxID=2954439 RepID=A0A9D7SJD9_9BACT|nr:NAD(P)-dependent oxidoreductase [Candidatus Geothrix skivensis]
MKVLVIGSSGFIGQALVSRLLAEGHEVEAWDRRTGDAMPRLTVRTVNLLDSAPLPPPEGRPWDAAFHLAAHSVPGISWNRDLVLENLSMTARVFDHLAEHARGCRAIYVSSAFVYAPKQGAVAEDDPTGSSHPYALSKLLGEAWVLSKKEHLQVFLVRSFNQIGPGMSPGLLIPDILARIRSGESPLLMRGRNDIRDFLDWRDAIDAYIQTLTVDAPSGRIWNLCSGRATPVSELVLEVLKAMSVEAEVLFANPNQETLVGNPARLMKDTGWFPRRSLSDTARAILEAPH